MLKQRRIKPTVANIVSAAIAGAFALAVVAGASDGGTAIGDPLAPPANQRLSLIVAASGVQIYECRAAESTAGGYAWVFVAPEATLHDARGGNLGRHGAGPYWEATDGSRIVGRVQQRADSPRAGAIPWLLLATTSSGSQGAFSRVTSVQRVNTVGGVAPATGCTRDTTGARTAVAYTADYRFYAAH